LIGFNSASGTEGSFHWSLTFSNVPTSHIRLAQDPLPTYPPGLPFYIPVQVYLTNLPDVAFKKIVFIVDNVPVLTNPPTQLSMTWLPVKPLHRFEAVAYDELNLPWSVEGYWAYFIGQNDLFDHPLPVENGPPTRSVDLRPAGLSVSLGMATREPVEPGVDPRFFPSHSVWYQWLAPGDGEIEIITPPRIIARFFSTLFKTTSTGSFGMVPQAQELDIQHSWSLVRATTNYHIATDGFLLNPTTNLWGSGLASTAAAGAPTSAPAISAVLPSANGRRMTAISIRNREFELSWLIFLQTYALERTSTIPGSQWEPEPSSPTAKTIILLFQNSRTVQPNSFACVRFQAPRMPELMAPSLRRA
jgi:hypothetical protein